MRVGTEQCDFNLFAFRFDIAKKCRPELKKNLLKEHTVGKAGVYMLSTTPVPTQ